MITIADVLMCDRCEECELRPAATLVARLDPDDGTNGMLTLIEGMKTKSVPFRPDRCDNSGNTVILFFECSTEGCPISAIMMKEHRGQTRMAWLGDDSVASWFSALIMIPENRLPESWLK